MQKVKHIDLLGLFNFFLLITICICLAVSQDSLLFKSDLINLVHFILGIHILLFVFLIIILAPVLFMLFIIDKKWKEKIATFISLLIPTNLLFGFTICVIDKFFCGIQPVRLFLIVAGSIYVGSFVFVIILFCQRKDEIRSRIIKISRRLMFFFLVAFMLLTLFRHIQKRFFYPHNKGTNVVMIVIDGVATKLLPLYNKSIKMEDFEEIAKESMLYMNSYTNFTYTYGYFKVIYSGRKDGYAKEKNLFSVLQQAGINTRWLACHTNGIPDAIHIVSYNGLRSSYLHRNMSWVPYCFGIDYNVLYFLSVNRFTLEALSQRQVVFRNLINKIVGGEQIRHPFETYLVDEIKKLRSEPRPYFLIFYTNQYGFAAKKNNNEIRKLWESINDKKDEVESKIRSNDLVYEEEDSWFARASKETYESKMRDAMKSLRKFFSIYKKEKWDKDTIIIVTSDHGRIFSKGKIWYIYHNDEEVTKIPLLIHDGKNQSIDNRLGETIDIAQTILEIFNIKERFSDKALSLIGDDNKKIITSLTHNSSKREEKLLNIYKHEKGHIYKYTFNIQDRNFAKKELVEGYDGVVIDEGNSVLDAIGDELKDVLSDYGIEYFR
jgi:hypothetical protein